MNLLRIIGNATHSPAGLPHRERRTGYGELPVEEQWPTVSVLMPLLDEAEGLEEVMESLRRQDYRGDWELVAVDGGSSDDTVPVLRSWQKKMVRLVVITSPHGRRSLVESLNLAADRAGGEIAVRADAHTVYEPDYIRRNVEALRQTGAVLVGGPMVPRGKGPFGKAVAEVMVNPWVVGPAPYRRPGVRRPADTVYLGAMRRRELRGYRFRGFPAGVAEDADLAHRIRKQGGEVVLDPAIRSRYRPRTGPATLWRQFYRYGRGKAEMLWSNRGLPSLRPLAPLALVGGLAGSAVVAFGSGRWWVPLLAGGGWLGYLAVVTRVRPLRWAAAAIMQLSNGLGMVIGLVAGLPRSRRSSHPRP